MCRHPRRPLSRGSNANWHPILQVRDMLCFFVSCCTLNFRFGHSGDISNIYPPPPERPASSSVEHFVLPSYRDRMPFSCFASDGQGPLRSRRLILYSVRSVTRRRSIVFSQREPFIDRHMSSMFLAQSLDQSASSGETGPRSTVLPG